jgi:hypothetical protein
MKQRISVWHPVPVSRFTEHVQVSFKKKKLLRVLLVPFFGFGRE